MCDLLFVMIRYMRKLNLLSILFLISSFSFAQEKPDSEILSWISYNKASGNKLTRTDSITIQINSRSGDHAAEIVIPYTKKDKISIEYAYIEDLSGNVVRKLKKNEIKDHSAISDISLYEDDFVKTFQLKHNTYPYKVVFSYQTVFSDFLQIFTWQPRYGTGSTVRQFKFVVDVPKDYAIKYKQNQINDPQISTSENEIKYVWTGSYVPKKKEANADMSEKLPQITVLPLEFKYGEKGSWESWTSFGNWIANLNKGMDILPSEEQRKIDDLLLGIMDNKEKVRILYQYLQDYTRYINVKIDVGGLKTYSASYVCTNKYGDCKALSNYMKSMLSYAGIPAYYTLVYGGADNHDLDKDFPSQAFNHVIVTVPFENDTVFLECTDKNMPFGYVGEFTQNRNALMIIPGNSRFVRIPALKPQDVLCERTIRTHGNENAEIEMICRGEFYESLAYLYHGDKVQTEKYINSQLLFGIPVTLQSWDLSKPGRVIPEVLLKTSVRLQNHIKRYGNNLVLPNFTYELPNFESPDKRTEDVLIHCPVSYRDSVLYDLNGSDVNKLPENIDVQTKYGSYHANYSLTDTGRLLLLKELEINSDQYPVSEYSSFYDFMTSVRNIEKKNIYIEIK